MKNDKFIKLCKEVIVDYFNNRVEITDDKIVKRKGKRHNKSGDNARHYSGKLNLKKRLHRSTSKVHCGFGKLAVELLYFRKHGKDNVGKIKGYMSYKQGSEAEVVIELQKSACKNEEQHH